MENQNRQASKYGHWVYVSREKGFICSCCKSRCLLNYESDWCESDYCPHCGTPMIRTIKEGAQ